MFNFFSVLARNMTRTDALFHAGIAALLVMGVTVGSNSGEWLWSSWNRGVGHLCCSVTPHSCSTCLRIGAWMCRPRICRWSKWWWGPKLRVKTALEWRY